MESFCSGNNAVQRIDIVENFEAIEVRKHKHSLSYVEVKSILLIHSMYSILHPKPTTIMFVRREVEMELLFLFWFCALLFLALVGRLVMRNGENPSRMINADWLDSSEKFNLITRWGA